MTTSLDECVFYLRHLQRRPSVEELSEMETKKKKIFEVPSHVNGPHQARTALAYSPTNPFY